ncbi:hypothetical protein NCHU2750_02040 [Neorhizobium sp. NCHU2750]|nr:hypothetical protein NCHU2750_02040 [Neorhizobium sp. NCHU2750]
MLSHRLSIIRLLRGRSALRNGIQSRRITSDAGLLLFYGPLQRVLAHSPTPGDAHAPCPAGPSLRPSEQRMGCFVKRGSCDLVTTSADLALDVGLAGLIAGRRQTKMGTDIARSTKAIGSVDGSTERQRGDRPDARYAYQLAACRLILGNAEHLFRETSALLEHRGKHRQQRLHQSDRQLLPGHDISHLAHEVRTAQCPKLDAAFPQNSPHDILD